MPIKILSLKPRTGNPYDSVETTIKAVFKRMPAANFVCDAEGPISLRKIMVGEYDILFGVGRPQELLAALLRPKKTKYIIHYQSRLLRKSEPGWRVRMPWLLRSFIFRQADMELSPSDFSAGTVRQFFPKLRVEYVLNGIDPAFFHPSKKNLPHLKEKFGVDVTRPIVTFVGALQIRKRPDVFIELARRFPGATFVSAGRAVPEEHDFLTGTEEIKNFKHIPAMSREDIAILLASSEMFIFPSLGEPAALSILEAMASGAVPILSKSGGNPEFLQDGVSGFLIPRNDRELDEFSALIKKLLADPKMQASFSAAARKEAEGHTWDVAAEQYRKLFESLAPRQ